MSIAAAATLVLSACAGETGGIPAGSTGPLIGEGPITLVQGKDVSGFVQQILDSWNQAHPKTKATLIELPESADAQRTQMIQNAKTKSDTYDVIVVDNVWTAEFAANRYIRNLPEDQFPMADFLKPVIESAKYRNRLYAVPNSSDGGMLYYRTDLLAAAGINEPPKTWAELVDACGKVQATPAGKEVPCYAGQFEKYEGLTVNASEAINSAGGEITDEEGQPNVDTSQAKAGLDFLVNGFKDGYIPKEAITYKEEEARRAFQEGRLIFERQWPYMWALANADDGSSKVAGKFAVAPLPGMNGPGTSSLGGHALGISSFSQHQKTALEFIKFYTSKENSQKYLELASQAPIYTSIYDDPALQKKFPYLPVLKESILTAIPRPKVVRYGDATLAIQDAAYEALSGQASTEAALAKLQKKLEELSK